MQEIGMKIKTVSLAQFVFLSLHLQFPSTFENVPEFLSPVATGLPKRSPGLKNELLEIQMVTGLGRHEKPNFHRLR
jgi:hypothetical protein